MLGVRPRIQPNESLSSYLLRLAAVNGFERLPQFLSILGMKKVKKTVFGLWRESQLIDLYQCLPTMLGRDIDDIKSQHNTLSKIVWPKLNHVPYSESNLVDFPRICIPCLLEKPIIDWRWFVAITPCCPIHHTPLLNNCPHCETPLKWHTCIFDSCEKCSTKWKDIHIEVLNYPKLLLASLFPDIDGHIQLSDKQIHALRLAIIFMARPYDAVIDGVNRFPETPHFWARIMRAIYLLTQPWYKARWKKEVHKLWPVYLRNICPVAVFDSADLQPAWETDLYQLPKIPSLAIVNEAHECIEFLKPHRRKLQKYNKKLSFNFHINHIQLAMTLNITTPLLLNLLEVKLFPSVNYTKILTSKMYDVKKIHRFIAPFLKAFQQATPVILNEESTLLPSYLMSFAETVKAVIEGDLNGYFVAPHSLAQLSVDSDTLQTWLTSNYKAKCKHSIVTSTAAKALGVPFATINIYVKQGQLHWAAWGSQHGKVNGQTFYGFHTPPLVCEIKSTSK